jgi:P4 family phage/plasmid primase-like protien
MVWPDAYYPGIEEDLQRANEEAWNLTVKWARKPFDEATIGIPEVDMAAEKREGRIFADFSAEKHSDGNMTNHFVELYGDSFVTAGKEMWNYNKVIKLWVEDNGEGLSYRLSTLLYEQYRDASLKLTKKAEELGPRLAAEQANAEVAATERYEEALALHAPKENERKRKADEDWTREWEAHADVIEWKRQCTVAQKEGMKEPKQPALSQPKFKSAPLPKMPTKEASSAETMKLADLEKKMHQKAKDLMDRAHSLQTARNLGDVMRMVRCHAKITQVTKKKKLTEIFDHKVGYLPICGGKMLNMQTLEVTDRDQMDYWTKESEARYLGKLTVEQEAEARQYFVDIMCGDEELVQMVLDLIKSALNGEILRYVFFCIGEGRNGKSLLFELLAKMLPGFVNSIDKKTIVKPKHESNTQDHLEPLTKARMGVVQEVSSSAELNEELAKTITGGDVVNGRLIYGANRNFTPTASLVVCTNHMLKFKDCTSVMDRFITIPFKARFANNNAFKAKMKSQAMLDTLFTYVMQQGRIICDFTPPTASRAEMALLREENAEKDPLAHVFQFWKTFVVKANPTDKIKTKDLITYLKRWMDEEDHRMPYNGDVTKQLKKEFGDKYGFTIDKRSFVGIKCTYIEDSDSDDEQPI